MKAGWEVRPVGEVAKVIKSKGGGRPLPYIGLEDISSGGTGEFLGSMDPQLDKSTTFEFDGRHLLYGRLRPYLNKVLRPNFSGHCSSEIFPLLPSTQLDRSFLFHWITSDTVVEKINATCTGARMPRANVNELLRFPIPLPPLEEQKRIVAILDQAFEGLDRARANAEANLRDARELFDAELNEVFGHNLSATETRTFDQVAEDTLIGLVRSKKEQGQARQYDYLKMQNIGNDDRFLGGIVDRVDCSPAEASRYSLERGDFLFNTRNSLELVGKSCVVVSDFERRTVFNNNIMRVRFSSAVLPSYVALAFKSQRLKKQLEAMKSGTTSVVAIYFNSLKKLLIPVPDKDTQKILVDRFDVLDAAVQRATSNYASHIVDLDVLRQSLLQRAFAGELT